MTIRYYTPICLYPHTVYRTAKGLEALFEKYDFENHDHLIVVADRLQALDNLVTGRYWSESSVYAKARREAEQIVSLVKRVSRKCGALARGKIIFWDDIAGTSQFESFAIKLREALLSDARMAPAIEEFVETRVGRFGLGGDPARERDHERDYLLSEVCMSVYCTEVLGYATEVWERPPAGRADPLKSLYGDCPELIEKVTGLPVRRALEFLSEREAVEA